MIDADAGAPPPPGPGWAPGARGELRPLHASEMRLLLACPTKWSHAHRARRVPRENPRALSVGAQVHAWLAGWWAGVPSELPEGPVARACCIGYDAHWGTTPPGQWSTEEPWDASIGGVACAGTVDAVLLSGETLVPDVKLVEHKTTSQDISPGSVYWRQVVTTDPQVSMYRAAFPGAKILYDVIRKPALRQKQGETEDAFVARMVNAMSEEPERYFARAYVVRLESEDDAFARDVQAVDALRRLPMLPRNPDSCFAYGTRCGYFGVCWEGASLDDDAMFRDQDEDR